MRCLIRFVAIAFALCIFATTVFASGGTLSYWYSDTNQIGRWNTSQFLVYTDKLNVSSNFSFHYCCANARREWESALGIPINLSNSAQDSNASIRFFGGTKDELGAIGMIVADNGEQGYTTTWKNNAEDWNYFSSIKKVYNMTGAKGYIIDDGYSSLDKYMNATTHEFGHAFGWSGHSTSSQDVMYSYCFGLYQLTQRDKNHLAQVY